MFPRAIRVWRGSPLDEEFIRRKLDANRPDGVICANDLTAARLMQTLHVVGMRIPEDVRIVGMDDVKYANLLPVPLTTIQQDCAGIGAVAMATMLERLEHPELPVRRYLRADQAGGSAFVRGLSRPCKQRGMTAESLHCIRVKAL